jgi:hypothetical protein
MARLLDGLFYTATGFLCRDRRCKPAEVHEESPNMLTLRSYGNT